MDVKDIPLDIIDMNQDEVDELRRYYKGAPSAGYIRVGPEGYVFPKFGNMLEQLSYYYNMTIRKTDIFVITISRSGTTMTQELVWLIANNLDYDTASSKYLVERYFTLKAYGGKGVAKVIKSEKHKLQNNKNIKKIQLMNWPIDVTSTSGSRYFMSHLPFCILPPDLLDTAKVVYVARNPLDVAVSMFYLNSSLKMYEFVGDFKTFWKLFSRDLPLYTPYFAHVKQAWNRRNHPNMLFLFYEDYIKDLPAAIQQISTFLNKSYDEEQIKGLCEHMKFENFKKNESVNLNFLKELDLCVTAESSFIRKGKTGGWRDYFDEEMRKQAASWIQENLRDTDLRFPELEVLLEKNHS